jgi:hypothetical protein
MRAISFIGWSWEYTTLAILSNDILMVDAKWGSGNVVDVNFRCSNKACRWTMPKDSPLPRLRIFQLLVAGSPSRMPSVSRAVFDKTSPFSPVKRIPRCYFWGIDELIDTIRVRHDDEHQQAWRSETGHFTSAGYRLDLLATLWLVWAGGACPKSDALRGRKAR